MTKLIQISNLVVSVVCAQEVCRDDPETPGKLNDAEISWLVVVTLATCSVSLLSSSQVTNPIFKHFINLSERSSVILPGVL